ncbi:MAG: CoA-transferase [Candidatus Geothermarchaeales archaeon]
MILEDPPTDKETIATFISREVKDGELVVVGTNLPLPRAGVLLAQWTHAPNLTIMLGPYCCNLLDQEEVISFEYYNDSRYLKYAETILTEDEIIEDASKIDVFFVGGLQVDRYGNTNLIGIGKDHKRLKVRGPGSLAIATMSTEAKRIYIYAPRLESRVFVEECDFVSALGWKYRGLEREKLGFRGGGPKYVITSQCIMDFEPNTKLMRLRAILPSVEEASGVDHIRSNVGFDLIVPRKVGVLEPPDEEELRVLRTKVDPRGALRS